MAKISLPKLKTIKGLIGTFIVFLCVFNINASDIFPSDTSGSKEPEILMQTVSVIENGHYTSKEEVAEYLHEFNHLPDNFITKGAAKDAGWIPSEGNLWDVCPGMSIGGDEFYNYDEDLPDAANREWTECDVNYSGGQRGPERIVFSNDGLIFYTADHYDSFEQLY